MTILTGKKQSLFVRSLRFIQKQGEGIGKWRGRTGRKHGKRRRACGSVSNLERQLKNKIRASRQDGTKRRQVIVGFQCYTYKERRVRTRVNIRTLFNVISAAFILFLSRRPRKTTKCEERLSKMFTQGGKKSAFTSFSRFNNRKSQPVQFRIPSLSSYLNNHKNKYREFKKNNSVFLFAKINDGSSNVLAPIKCTTSV